jgi:integrase/recombinase XerD
MNTNPDILETFKQALIDDGKSLSTIESYFLDIKCFFEWLESKGTSFTGNLKRFHITSYRNYLQEKEFEISTINKKINSLLAFNHFLMDKNLMREVVVDVQKDKLKIAKGSERAIAVFSDLETDQILFYMQNESKNSIRDRMIILLLIYTGIRASELTSIKTKDVDFLTMQLKISSGKGNKYREIPLRDDVVESIREYQLKERPKSKFSNSEYLILTQRSPKMDRDALNKICKRLSRELKISIYPHKFRHNFCTKLIQKGVNAITVAKIAGHASIQTTISFYVNTSRQEKIEAINLL